MNTPAKTAADVVDQMTKPNTVTVPQQNHVMITDHNPEDDFADVRKRDIMTPRIMMLQPTSPLVVDSNGAYRGGQFIDGSNILCNGSGESFEFIPLIRWLHWTEWNPDRKAPSDKRILSRSFDINSWQAKEAEAFTKVKDPEGKEKLKITEYFNYIICVPGNDKNYSNLYMWNFARSSHKMGKMFLNRLMRIRQPNGSVAAMYMNKFSMTSKMEKKDDLRWFVPVIGPTAAPIPVEDHEELKEMVIGLKNRQEEMKQRMVAKELEEAEHVASHVEGKPEF
jgi:hypothetical protein